MDGKTLLLLLLGVSFLFFGCAKKGEAAPEAPGAQLGPSGETTTPEPEATPSAEANATPSAPNATAGEDDGTEALADLFRVETDKPLEDEGLDTSTPKSKE